MYPVAFRGDLFDDLSVGQRIGCRSLVGPYQSGNAQLYAAEISYHHYKYVAQPAGIYLAQDRTSR